MSTSVLEKMGIVVPDVQLEQLALAETEGMPRLDMALGVAKSQLPHIFALATA